MSNDNSTNISVKGETETDQYTVRKDDRTIGVEREVTSEVNVELDRPGKFADVQENGKQTGSRDGRQAKAVGGRTTTTQGGNPGGNPRRNPLNYVYTEEELRRLGESWDELRAQFERVGGDMRRLLRTRSARGCLYPIIRFIAAALIVLSTHVDKQRDSETDTDTYSLRSVGMKLMELKIDNKNGEFSFKTPLSEIMKEVFNNDIKKLDIDFYEENPIESRAKRSAEKSLKKSELFVGTEVKPGNVTEEKVIVVPAKEGENGPVIVIPTNTGVTKGTVIDATTLKKATIIKGNGGK